jgi:hypothetical protein
VTGTHKTDLAKLEALIWSTLQRQRKLEAKIQRHTCLGLGVDERDVILARGLAQGVAMLKERLEVLKSEKSLPS